jgi:hypothetical protein
MPCSPSCVEGREEREGVDGVGGVQRKVCQMSCFCALTNARYQKLATKTGAARGRAHIITTIVSILLVGDARAQPTATAPKRASARMPMLPQRRVTRGDLEHPSHGIIFRLKLATHSSSTKNLLNKMLAMGHLTVPMALCWLLVGQHVEPSLADSSLTHPMVASGGATCTDEWDCSLGGECTAGVCVCDHWCVCCWPPSTQLDEPCTWALPHLSHLLVGLEGSRGHSRIAQPWMFCCCKALMHNHNRFGAGLR